MNLFLGEKARGNAYLASILLVSLIVRMALGAVHPQMPLDKTALVGVTTVLLAAPSLYRFFYHESMIKPNKRLQYVALSVVACGLFLYYIAFDA
ncbi:MAG TPA: hypothetical protein V6D05_13875 [Stenomitos sp.]